MKKWLWLGSYQSLEYFNNMPIPNMGQASAYTSQKGIIKGIDACLKDVIMDSINCIPFSPYPIYPKKNVSGTLWSRNGFSTDKTVSYKNTKYFTYYYREKAIVNETKRWMKKNDCGNVLVYAPSVGKMISALKIKKKLDSKIYIIIPDIPEQISLEANKIIRFAKKIASFIMKMQFKKADGFILYSSDMADYYNLSETQWMLMEGVVDKEEASLFNPNCDVKLKKETPIKMTYCGVLNQFRGTPELLNAFMNLKGNYELHLIGNGDSVPLIKRCCDKDQRIIYHGFINDRKKIIELENDSDILLHIRQTEPKKITGYCFPSKLFEYLVSGKPVISVDLPGIPEEYFKYMFKITSLSEKNIMNAINKVLDTSDYELNEIVKKARDFILLNKSSDVQGARICDFINK